MKCLIYLLLLASFEIHGSLATSLLKSDSCMQGYFCEHDRQCGLGFCTQYRQCNCGPNQNPPTPSPITNTLIPFPSNCIEEAVCMADWTCGRGFCEKDENNIFQSGYSMRTNLINSFVFIGNKSNIKI